MLGAATTTGVDGKKGSMGAMVKTPYIQPSSPLTRTPYNHYMIPFSGVLTMTLCLFSGPGIRLCYCSVSKSANQQQGVLLERRHVGGYRGQVQNYLQGDYTHFIGSLFKCYYRLYIWSSDHGYELQSISWIVGHGFYTGIVLCLQLQSFWRWGPSLRVFIVRLIAYWGVF